jgi:hypothetical protein
VTTLDRRRWLAERIRFLEGQRETAASDAQRAAIDAELESLRKEAGPSRWWRRLLGIPGLPTDR